MKKITRRTFLAAAAAGAVAPQLSFAGGEDITKMPDNNTLPRRTLGKTGEKVSILTFGGFHLVETLPEDADKMLNSYLDQGGNFIETAPSYGRGNSEIKIGRVMRTRRAETFLSTKAHHRTKDEVTRSIDSSLKNLQTDHLDNLFMHNVQTLDDLKQIMAPGGALKAAEEARATGKVRYISITSHTPEVLIQAVKAYPFDAVMEWMNYYDYFNFPVIYRELIPLCREKGVGLIIMKPIGDGFLYRNPETALRWAMSLPVDTVCAGNNTMELLKKNIEVARKFAPMTEAEKEKLYKTAPEYANYVCRQCGKCPANKLGLDLPKIFELEGYYDRQMYTGDIPDAAEYALRERLRFWFGNQDIARARYEALEKKVPKDFDAADVDVKCPYGIDVPRKLRIAAWKLTGDEDYLMGNG